MRLQESARRPLFLIHRGAGAPTAALFLTIAVVRIIGLGKMNVGGLDGANSQSMTSNHWLLFHLQRHLICMMPYYLSRGGHLKRTLTWTRGVKLSMIILST